VEVEMRNVKWLLAAGLIAATTAGCVESNGYPNTAYNNGYNNGYSRNGTYYSNAPAAVYTPAPVYNSGYAYNNTPPRRGPNGDYDRDGIPNKYDRDANGDGVPDRFQR
jgi:hypothetical protein